MSIFGGIFPRVIQLFRGATGTDGGTAGGVPAPEAGQDGFFLRGDGVWAAVSGAGVGDVTGPGSSTENAVVRWDNTSGEVIKNSTVILTNSGTFQGIEGLLRDNNDIDIATTTGGDINILAADDVVIQDITYPNTDGDAGQAIVTDGDGNLSFADVAADISRNNLVHVDGELGDDDNDGKLGNPFATIQAAIDSITGATDDFNRYGVIIAPGDYTEDITMKLSVNLYGVGSTPELVRINGDMTFNAPGAFAHRVEVANLLWRNGTVTMNNTGGSAHILRARAANFSSMNFNVTSAQLQIDNCGFFGGTITMNSNAQTFFLNCTFSNTNYVVNGNVTSQVYDGNALGGTWTLNAGSAFISMALSTATYNVETGAALTINADTAGFAAINENGGTVSYLNSGNRIAAAHTAQNYTPTTGRIAGHLAGIDERLVELMLWEVVTSDEDMELNTGYVVNDTSLVTLTLPTEAAVGDKFKIINNNTGGWRVAQNADQTIRFGTTTTTTGVSGYIESTENYDVIELICVNEDNDFVVTSSVGNLNLE